MSSKLAWSPNSLGPLPTLPPVFTKQSHFSMTTRLRLALRTGSLGPASPPQPLYLEGTIGGAGPGPCCCWWLGLPGALVKVDGWALT